MMRGMFLVAHVFVTKAVVLPAKLSSDAKAVADYESRYTKIGCTTIVVGPKATVDGSVIATHNADCLNCDFRLAVTPARSHPAGSSKSVLKYKSDYPHWVTSDRSPVWAPENLDSDLPQSSVWAGEDFRRSLVVGFMPEVPRTFAVVEGLFGIMNDQGVAIGESTCASVWFGKPPRACPDCDGPLVDVSFLTVVALERCATARCAIETIGGLAQSLGYYAADVTKPEGGEALSVIDSSEAWMFHVLPDQEGTGAVWVAQRLGDDHVAACANAFVIRGVQKGDLHFLYSDNLWSAAEAAGLWAPAQGTLDFAAVYGFDTSGSAYSTRRQWRVLDLASPSLKLPSAVDWLGDGLPFSVKVDKLLHVSDVMAMKRDFYEGTQFDLSKGVGGGPYGDPRRFDGNVDTLYNGNNLTLSEQKEGGFERPISMFRTSYSQISVSRVHSPANSLTKAVVWVCQYAPHMSVYTPIYVAAGAVPASLSTGNLYHYSPLSAFWQACSVGNWAAHFFKYAITDVRAVQSRLEADAFQRQAKVEAHAAGILSAVGGGEGAEAAAAALLVEFSSSHCARFMSEYSELFHVLIAKYHDGYSLEDPSALDINMRRLFYPKWWLKVAGYWSAYDYPPLVSAPFDSMDGGGAPLIGSTTFYAFSLSRLLLAVSSYAAVAAFAYSLASKRANNKHGTDNGNHVSDNGSDNAATRARAGSALASTVSQEQQQQRQKGHGELLPFLTGSSVGVTSRRSYTTIPDHSSLTTSSTLPPAAASATAASDTASAAVPQSRGYHVQLAV